MSDVTCAGGRHLMPLLQLMLPAIDVNDSMKTAMALYFVNCVLTNIPLVDCSQDLASCADDNERDMRLATAGIQDWVVTFLGRLLLVLETQVAAGSNPYSMEESQLRRIARCTINLFQQLSPEIGHAAVTHLFKWVQTHMTLDNANAVGWICHAAALAFPSYTLSLFLPLLREKICELGDDLTQEGSTEAAEDVFDSSLQWYLEIAARVVKHGGAFLVPYEDDICQILDTTLRVAAKKTSKTAGKMLRHLFVALTSPHVRDRRAVPPSVWAHVDTAPGHVFARRCTTVSAAPEPFQDHVDVMAPEVTWEEPTDATRELACTLVDVYVAPACRTLRGLISGEGPEDARVLGITLRNCLQVLRNFVRACAPVLNGLDDPAEDEDPSDSCQMPTTAVGWRPLTCSVTGPQLEALVLEASTWLRTTRPDDTKNHVLLLKITQFLLTVRGMRERKLKSYMATSARRLDMSNPIVRRNLMSRSLLVSDVMAQHFRRLVFNRLATPLHRAHVALALEVTALGQHTYPHVRKKAQSVLNSCFSVFPALKHHVHSVLLAPLHGGVAEEQHPQIKGALATLLLPPLTKLHVRRFSYLAKLVEALVCQEKNEKKSVQNIVATLVQSIGRLTAPQMLVCESSSDCLHWARVLSGGEEHAGASVQPEKEDIPEGPCVEELVHVCKTLLSAIQGASHWIYRLLFANLLGKMLVHKEALLPEVCR